MSQDNEKIKSLLSLNLDSYEKEYRELWEVWRHLENKAQGTIAISGIFVAGVFAFIHTSGPLSSVMEKILLSLSILLLIISIILSILVLRIREFISPPIGDSLDNLVKDITESKEEITSETILNFINDQSLMWKKANKKLNEVNSSKAKYLLGAQWVLLAAIVIMAFLTLITLY